MSKPKQILIWRSDLRNADGHKVRSGKMAAQLAHASLAAVLSCAVPGLRSISISLMDEALPLGQRHTAPHALRDWLEGQYAKICVSVNSEQELLDIIQKAKDLGLITSLITDAGLTEFNGVPTITCGCVGPAYPEQLEGITDHLPLL